MSGTSNLQHLADWDACEAGELRRVVRHMKSRRRNQNIVKIGGLAVILLLCAFAGTLIWQQFDRSDRFDYGGITCKEVQDQMADYSRGKVPPKIANQIRIHLSKCPNCRAVEQPALSFAKNAARDDESRQPIDPIVRRAPAGVIFGVAIQESTDVGSF